MVMRVLVLAQYFPPDMGGGATRAYNVAAGLLKAGKILGYEPKTDMKTGLNKTYEWVRENQEHIERVQSLSV